MRDNLQDKNYKWIYTYDYAPDSVWEPWRVSDTEPSWIQEEAETVADRVRTNVDSNLANDTKQDGKNLLTFLLLADTHFTYNGTWQDTVSSMKALGERLRIDGVIHLGDLTDGLLPLSKTKEIESACIEDMKSLGVPLYVVPGNHDYNYFRGNPEVCYPERPRFFVDFEKQKLRLIFIDSFDPNDEVRYGFTEECVSWLDASLSTIPDGSKAIIFSHLTPLVRLQSWTKEIRNGSKIVDVLNKYADKIIAFINGHNHCDHIFNDLENCQFPIISINCAKCEYFTHHKPMGSKVPYRELGTRLQESFDVMQIDTENAAIYFTRFGAGSDRAVKDHKGYFLNNKQADEGRPMTDNDAKIREVLLELLQELKRVCDEHDLRYYIFFGTLLGAVRNEGFLSWDDDADIVMPAEDYRELCLHKEWFGDEFFLQTPMDEGYPRYAKLRKNNTTVSRANLTYILRNGGHLGVPIDIIPLALIPNTGSFWTPTISGEKGEKVYLQEWFEPSREIEFENLSLRAPAEPEKILTETYGEWEVPSDEDCKSPYLICDLERGQDFYYKRFTGMFDGIEGKKISLFGAADSLRIWLERFGLRDQVVCTFDNDKEKWGKKFYGVEVRNPADIPKLLDEKSRLIIVSIWYREIGKQLEEMGICDYYVFLDFYFDDKIGNRVVRREDGYVDRDFPVDEIRRKIRHVAIKDIKRKQVVFDKADIPEKTECERIISKGVISPDFLKPETRNGFYIDAERKKLWTVSLDLLLELDRVCKKHGIGYFLTYGSLLGAVRHKGFIPWDDDADVFMWREDFDKFLKVGDEFNEPYFLQTPYTEKGFFYTDIRLRNSNTSWIDKTFMYQGFNNGIHVSVAVLDYLPENARVIHRANMRRIMQNSMYMRLTNPDLSERDKIRTIEFLGDVDDYDPLKTYESIVDSVRDMPVSEKMWTGCNQTPNFGHDVFYSEDFAQTITLEFEGFSFPAPIGYERILSTLYGDFMAFPPEEKRVITHNTVVYNADIPYNRAIRDLE